MKFNLYFTMKMAKKWKKRHKGILREKSSYIGFSTIKWKMSSFFIFCQKTVKITMLFENVKKGGLGLKIITWNSNKETLERIATRYSVVWQGIETPFFPFFKIYLYFNGFLTKNEKWRHFTLFSKKSYIRGFFPYFSLMSFFSLFCHFHSKNKLNFKLKF